MVTFLIGNVQFEHGIKCYFNWKKNLSSFFHQRTGMLNCQSSY